MLSVRLQRAGHLLARFLCYSVFILGFSGICLAQAELPIGSEPEAAKLSRELDRVRILVRANVLELAQEILETQGPEMQPNSDWLHWERQLWALYRIQGQWQMLYQRTRQLPPAFPKSIRREAELQAIHSLTALKQGSRARTLIRKQLLSMDVSEQYKRELRKSMISTYLADGLLSEARISMRNFQQDYRSQEPDWLLLSARVHLQSGDADSAINLLAPMDQPAARLLRLYARLENNALQPDQVIDRALKLKASAGFDLLLRDIQAVVAQAFIATDNFYPLADALEDYLVAPISPEAEMSRIYPGFEIQDLLDVYFRISQEQANNAGLLIGDELRWLEYAQQMPATEKVARKSMFAYLALSAKSPFLRQRSIDAYVNVLIDDGRMDLIERLFAEDTAFGKLSLGGQAGFRLSNFALEKGNIQLAAEANANLSALPPGMDRLAWLLHAGRISIIAGRYREGADKLNEWVESFSVLQPVQTDMVLQPIFDLQTVAQHQLALELLHKVDDRSPSAKFRREISYWIAESYSGTGQFSKAADMFLFSALQKADGFDQWGESARFHAAQALMDGKLFNDARQLYEDMLSRAKEEKRQNLLKQKLQQLWLLESNLHSPENDQ